jgi:hypothetical protein
MLHLKKQIAWIQPVEKRGIGSDPTLTFSQIIETCRKVPDANIQGWKDIDRIDVRPSKGMLKVWAKSSWEVQLDIQSGAVLQVAYRRSDLIEAIHDGSWFHPRIKYGVFLPAGVCMLLLWASGMYLFALPYVSRWRRGRASGSRVVRASSAADRGALDP